MSSEQTTEGHSIPEEDMLRAQFYGLLSRLLAEVPSDDLLQSIADMEGDQSPIGQALTAMGEKARSLSTGEIADEFNALFYGHGAGGEINRYASFYLTGALYEKPLSDLRKDMLELGMIKADDLKEPEDSIAVLCEIMHGLITGKFGEVAPLDVQQNFFNTHIAPWGFRFFEDLEGADASNFFKPVGAIGRAFLSIEAEAFEMAA